MPGTTGNNKVSTETIWQSEVAATTKLRIAYRKSYQDPSPNR